MGVTDDRTDPRLTRGIDSEPRPQAEMYLVLSEAARARGFVRPVRRTYIHRGIPACGACPHGNTDHVLTQEDDRGPCLRDLPGGPCPCPEFVSTPNSFSGGCGGTTTMGQALAETYARQPSFYGATYCVHCEKHRPVAEFVWDGTTEVVGS